jgi:TrmH family RNA methyltransferase
MPATLISSRANPRVKQLRAAFAGHARLSGGLVAIEGEHLLFEAKRSGLAFKTIFLSERTSSPEWMPRSVELIELSEEVFASVVDTQSPQGIAALLVPPTWAMDSALASGAQRGGAPLLLIAAGLQDPGNLGTLIRSAEAFAASAVLTTPGTVSQWNQKALRASAGSVFRMPVIAAAVAEIAAIKARGVWLYAAAADPGDARSLSLGDADLTQGCALMIGNEGAGLTEELLQLADARLAIPTPGPVESLNAAIAGSLLLYEASRQRTVLHGHSGELDSKSLLKTRAKEGLE